MKKIFIPILLLVQVTGFSQVTFGWKFGVSLSDYTMDYTTYYANQLNTSIKAGYVLGAFVDVPLNKKLCLRPGLELVRKGGREAGSYRTLNPSDSYHESTTRAFGYLDVPISLIYKLKGHSAATPFVGLGPTFSLLTGNPVGFPYIHVKNADIGINGLAGYQSAGGFSIMVNYTYGLKNVSNEKGVQALYNYYGAITLSQTF